ncbi:MAG TPA: 2-polyprenyl-3-methyl-6-methoxy-1,4-benzoquinone monooxygenase [Rhodocyclaceae bacterium]|jgi:ubiquinone biosynthesis monooxygenase Coq7
MMDRVIVEFDKALRAVFAAAPTTRMRPGEHLPEADLSESEKRHAAALMRINHCGEICAQALYQGQALTSRNPETRATMEHAAWQETEHLNWTEKRIEELGGRKSVLNPFWYASSLAIGVTAGILGDDWNLGFLAETERQVEGHLDSHLSSLPAQDVRSREVVSRMKDDEIAHAETAIALGARELPLPVKLAMRAMSKVMTGTAYHL